MVRQTQINPEIGLTFAEGLRFLLRQDPDIIMVGEIRDKETAQIAVQAAITGHLVLATIHTNNAAGAVVRLINMQVEPFLLATSLRLVTAQRLARINCPYCRKEYAPSEEIIKKLNLEAEAKYYHSVGCDKCEGRGTSGRIGIHELLVLDRPIENLILTCPSDDQINEVAAKNGMISLREAAFAKAREGVISIEEAIRVVE
jgi:type II secretory ATPase GspE/PulE/Tfp pilus assembly ATPase PilB-like protein